MSAESSPVDVLAVMDRDSADAENYRRAASTHYADSGVQDSSAARAAIAELIEAANRLQHTYRLMDTDPDFVRLRAALNDCGESK